MAAGIDHHAGLVVIPPGMPATVVRQRHRCCQEPAQGQRTAPEQLLARFRDMPLNYEPGSVYQYENSDCLNGAVLRVPDGYRYVEALPSHHAVLATGDLRRRLELVSPVLGLGVQHI